MLREMDDAVAQAIDATSRTAGTLRINTLSMAAKKIIAPRLGRFHRSHPEVVLDIVIDDGLSDIVAGGFVVDGPLISNRTSSCPPRCRDWEFSMHTTTMESQKHWSAGS